MVYAEKPLQFSLVTCPFNSPELVLPRLLEAQSFNLSPKSLSLLLECKGSGMGVGEHLLMPSVFLFNYLSYFF